MEELIHHPILNLTLAPSFDHQQWLVLTQQKPSVYQRQVATISKHLDKHMPELTVQYYKFIQNQITLKHWHSTQRQLQDIIEPYLFNLQESSQLKLSLDSFEVSRIFKTEPNPVRQYFAQSTGSPNVPDELALGSINNYDLYLSTLNACRGKKYTAYDYQKHMKNSKESKKYNQYIRINHKRNISNPMQRSHKLAKFEEFKPRIQKKTSLVNFRGILEDINLNSQRGLSKFLKKQGTEKLVLINHMRKPVNYYLSNKKLKG